MELATTSSNPSLYEADYLYLWKTLKKSIKCMQNACIMHACLL
nr:MAG TPA: hypothetical protein [Caudoviricetes sp.]